MAEILVRGHDSWFDALTPEQISNLSEQELSAYNARQKKGDIIQVREDNTDWKLPKVIILKVADMTTEEALSLVGANISDTQILGSNAIFIEKTKAEVEALVGGE